MTTKEERIKLIRKHFGLSKRQFAELIGMSEITIVKIESGENKVGANTLRNVLNAFPNINKDWFVLGFGSMLPPDGSGIAYEGGAPYTNPSEFNNSNSYGDGDVIFKGGKVYMDITSAFKSYFDDMDFINHMFANKQNSWRPTVEKLNKLKR